MIDLLEDIIVDGNEYTLVDNFEFNGIMLNCYLGDEYLFSFVKDGKEHFITDKKIIEAIKKQERLNNPEIYFLVPVFLHLFAKELKRIKGEDLIRIKTYFIDLIRNSGMNVDLDRILRKLSRVKFISGKPFFNAEGIYHLATNSVVFPYEDNIESTKTLVHETIHACGGKLYYIVSPTGFIEGAVELATYRLLGILNSMSQNYRGVIFNSSYGYSYTFSANLVNQMEYMINMTSSESILSGNLYFLNTFSHTYGRSVCRFMRHRLTRLSGNKDKDVDYFLKTQRKLFEKVFNKDIKSVNSLETAQAFINKLKNYEYMIGNVPNNLKSVGFVDYYERKLAEIGEILFKNNVSQQDVTSFIQANSHKRVVFPTTLTFEEATYKPKTIFTQYIQGLTDFIIKNQFKLDADLLDYYMGTCGNDNIDYIITYNGFPFYHMKRRNRYIEHGGANPSEIIKTESGYKTFAGEDQINLVKVEDRAAIERIIGSVNEQIFIKLGSNSDLIIQKGQYKL